MSTNQEFLQSLYDAFNKREIETIISLMRPDVKWANGLEGGFTHGRDAVREYWTTQFQNILPELETLDFETDENGRDIVTVHQVVKDLQGNVLADMTVRQIFTIEDGLISRYEIGETATIQEMIEKTAWTETVKAAYAALNRGDIDSFVKDFDAQILRVEFEGTPNGGTYREIEAVKAHVAAGRSTWAEGTCEPERFVTVGDKIVASCHVRVRLKGQTDWLEGGTADVFIFRDGKITEFRTFADEQQAMQFAEVTLLDLDRITSTPNDFDFALGDWNVKHRRLKELLTGCEDWVEFDGTMSTRKILGGNGNLEDNFLDLPGDPYRAVALRSFDPLTNRWSIWWLDGRNPTSLDIPVVGGFADRKGLFYADDELGGKPIKVRFTWISSETEPRWEQAFSNDSGVTWETNWTMDFHRSDSGQ